MAAFDEPDLLEEDFPVTTKRTTVMSDDREELDHQATSLQTKLAELNRAREKLEREKATVEDSRRRFSEFQTGREEMMHELTRSLGLMEEAHMDTQRDAEQMARTIEDLRDAMSKVETLEEVDTHDEQWKVLLTRCTMSRYGMPGFTITMSAPSCRSSATSRSASSPFAGFI